MAARCPPLPDAIPALTPGDLNKMLERIVETAPGNRTLTEEERKQLAADEMTEYSVVVHSRPSDAPATEISLAKDKELPPWVITFENFITPEECEAMIQLGYKYEYKRSADVGVQKFDGSHEAKESKGRTSENAWCSMRHGCRNETIPTRIHNRMSKVMRIPAENSEDLQLLKYEVGQYYNTHHDYIPHQKGTKMRNMLVFVLLACLDHLQ
jgi:prolyl 4-hydroxylase